MASGIWTRLGAMVPGSRETWRHYTGEIAVVVIGVLIALGADQAVRYVNDRAEAAEARERIKVELATLMGFTAERTALQACSRAQVTKLSQGLVSGRQDWSGFVFTGKSRIKGTLREMYHMPSRTWITDAYDEARALGSLDTAPAQEKQALAAIYTMVQMIAQWNDEESVLSSRLAVLQFNPELTQTERNELVGVLARLDTINGFMVLVASQTTDQYAQLGSAYRLQEAAFDAMHGNISQQMAVMREVYGDCANIDALRVIDLRLR